MGSLSRLLKAISQWLDTRFPEKISTAEVMVQIQTLEGRIASYRNNEIMDLKTQVETLQKEVVKLNDELNKMKTFIALKSRITGNGSPGVPAGLKMHP